MDQCPACQFPLRSEAKQVCPDCAMDLAPGADLEYALELRRRTDMWQRPPRNLLIETDKAAGALIAWMDLSDIDANSGVLTVGAHVAGGEVRCDRVHNQLLALPATPTSLSASATGRPRELAAFTADWLASVAVRPILRMEWDLAGRVESRHVVEGTGEALAETRDCPRDKPADRVVTATIRY